MAADNDDQEPSLDGKACIRRASPNWDCGDVYEVPAEPGDTMLGLFDPSRDRVILHLPDWDREFVVESGYAHGIRLSYALGQERVQLSFTSLREFPFKSIFISVAATHHVAPVLVPLADVYHGVPRAKPAIREEVLGVIRRGQPVRIENQARGDRLRVELFDPVHDGDLSLKPKPNGRDQVVRIGGVTVAVLIDAPFVTLDMIDKVVLAKTV